MAKIAGAGAIWRTLGIANYRNYMAGNFCAQLGMWVQRIAVQWLTWQLTNSPTWLGIVAFADFFFSIMLAPLAGALADHLDRLFAIRLYMWISGCVSATLAVLAASDAITIELLLVLVALNGTAVGFSYPARLAIIHALVGRESLTSAIGINELALHIARIGGTAISGLIIVKGGVGSPFAFTAVADVAFIGSLYLIRLAPDGERPEWRPARHMPAEILEGFRYAMKHAGIGPLLVILAATTLFAYPLVERFKEFSGDAFGLGAPGLVWLGSMLGLGAFIGGVYVTLREGVRGLTGLLVSAVMVFAVALAGFAATDIFGIALACAAVAEVSMMILSVAGQSLLQASVDGAMRGRVLSMYILIARGLPSVGALITGYLAPFVGLRWPVFGGAVLCLGLWVWARRRQAQMASSLEAAPVE